MSVIRVIRVRRVQEREFRILTVILSNFVLELDGVGRCSNETGSGVDNRYYDKSKR